LLPVSLLFLVLPQRTLRSLLQSRRSVFYRPWLVEGYRGFRAVLFFSAMVWFLPSAPVSKLVLLKRISAPVVVGFIAAALFNTVFVVEFWVLFAAMLFAALKTGLFSAVITSSGPVHADWLINMLNCPLPFFVAFLAQLFGVNDAIYALFGFSETVIITVTSEDSSSQNDDKTDETENDNNETENNDDATDYSADPEDEGTSVDKDTSNNKDGEGEVTEEDEEDDDDEVTEGEEDVSEDGDNNDETEPISSTTTEVIVSDGPSGSEVSASTKPDVHALPSKNPVSSHSAASTPTVGICSAVAAVVVSIVAFFF